MTALQRFNAPAACWETTAYDCDQILGREFSIVPGVGYLLHRPLPTPNSPPTARVSAPLQELLGAPLVLDGSVSHDADDDALFFGWQITSTPPGATETFDDPTISVPRLSVASH